MKRLTFSEVHLLKNFPFRHGNPVVVDVGGHIGTFSKPFVESGWGAILFEPEPSNHAQLVENMKEFSNQVLIINKAVSDTAGQKIPFYVSSDHWGIHSLKPFHKTHSKVIEVETVRLDETLEALNVDFVSILKIDIEGADFLALKGFDFQRYRPEAIVVEFMDNRSITNYGYDHHDMVSYMWKQGYYAFVAEWGEIKEYGRKGVQTDPHEFLRCVPYPLDHEPAWGNIIFVEFERFTDMQEAARQTVRQMNPIDDTPLVSVVVPCYNAEKTLVRTIASVLNEKKCTFEIILVDDGSTDNTLSIIRELEKADSRIHGYHTPNCGVSHARNTGVKLAKGDYIAFLDSDDIFMKDTINARMQVLLEEDDDHLIGVYCPALLINMQGEELQTDPLFIRKMPNNRLYFNYTSESLFNPTSLILKKDKFLASGGFDEKLLNGEEDYELWHRLMRTGDYYVFTPNCLIGWTQHEQSLVHKNTYIHYQKTKSVSEKIFMTCESDNCAREFENGFGASQYYSNLTRRALRYSITAAIHNDFENAKKIADDISELFLSQMTVADLLVQVKFNVCRVYCVSFHSFPEVWGKASENVITFLKWLNHKYDGRLSTIYWLIKIFSLKEDI